MGGAIGTPLLIISFLLVAAVVCIIKKNQGKSNRRDPATTSTQMTDIHMAEISSGKKRIAVEISPSPFIYDSENMIYSTIQDEDKTTLSSANYDEYIDSEVNPAYNI